MSKPVCPSFILWSYLDPRYWQYQLEHLQSLMTQELGMEVEGGGSIP